MTALINGTLTISLAFHGTESEYADLVSSVQHSLKARKEVIDAHVSSLTPEPNERTAYLIGFVGVFGDYCTLRYAFLERYRAERELDRHGASAYILEVPASLVGNRLLVPERNPALPIGQDIPLKGLLKRRNPLQYVGIQTLAEAAGCSREFIARIEGVGPQTLEILDGVLADHSLSYAA